MRAWWAEWGWLVQLVGWIALYLTACAALVFGVVFFLVWAVRTAEAILS